MPSGRRWPVSTRNAATRRTPCASSVSLPRSVSRRSVSEPKPTTTRALAPAEELGMRPLQAHCHLGLGTLYAIINQREQARSELSTAIAPMLQGHDLRLPQAEATLAHVEGRLWTFMSWSSRS